MILVGDCVERMRELPDGSVDAICTDPPYGLEFMGKDWDAPWRARDAGGNGGSAWSRRRATGTDWKGDTRDRPGRLYMRSFHETCQRCRKQKHQHDDTACPEPQFEREMHEPTQLRAFQAWSEAWAREALRVLKPGGHLLAFGGTRTWHRLACAIEDAGFEVRDCLSWMYGSGFPKSLDVSKAIDKAAGAEREVVAQGARFGRGAMRNRSRVELGYRSTEVNPEGGVAQVTAPATPDAERWSGWGTALKPAWEPIVVARKPLAGTVAAGALEHGTGALNIDACRIGGPPPSVPQPNLKDVAGRATRLDARSRNGEMSEATGRWPANVVLSHSEDCVLVGERQVRANGHFPGTRGASGYGSSGSHPESTGGGLKGQDDLEERRFDGELVEVWACVAECPVRQLDAQTGELRTGKLTAENQVRGGFAGTVNAYGTAKRGGTREYEASAGGASRFFYCAKASGGERHAGLEEHLPRTRNARKRYQQDAANRWRPRARNDHPTVKPIDVMRWLVRLVIPPGGIVLDPFLGSGTTGCAAVLEGFEFVGIERDPEYVRIAEARIRFWREHPTGLPAEQALEGAARRRRVRELGQLGLEF